MNQNKNKHLYLKNKTFYLQGGSNDNNNCKVKNDLKQLYINYLNESSKDNIVKFKKMLKKETFNNIKACIELNDLTNLSNDEYIKFLIDLYENYLYDDTDNYISSKIKNTTLMNKIQQTNRYQKEFNNTLESSKVTDTECCIISGGN